MRICGKTVKPAANSCSVRPLRAATAQKPDGRHQAVAGRVAVQVDHVPGLLAAQPIAAAAHGLEHVAVADRSANQADPVRAQRTLESDVAHHGRDDGAPGSAPWARRSRAMISSDVVAVEQRRPLRRRTWRGRRRRRRPRRRRVRARASSARTAACSMPRSVAPQPTLMRAPSSAALSATTRAPSRSKTSGPMR